jgi:hypothetical protein
LLEILGKWGIRSLGALAGLSGPEIHERLGERGALWQSLARGVDARPMVPWVEEIPFEAALELEWPIEGLEPLSFVLARLSSRWPSVSSAPIAAPPCSIRRCASPRAPSSRARCSCRRRCAIRKRCAR